MEIVPKLAIEEAATLLDDAAAFLAAPGESDLPTDERALLEKICALKK